MPYDLLAIRFQLNCQPWVWPIFPFIPSSENKYTCTKHPHADFSVKTLFSTWNNAEVNRHLPRCRNPSLAQIRLQHWSACFNCAGIITRVSNFFYSIIYLVNIGQLLGNLHFASPFGEGLSAQTQLSSTCDQSHRTIFQYLTTRSVLMSENSHLILTVLVQLSY